MINVLTISWNYNKSFPGGAARSFINMMEGLKKDSELQVSNVYIKSFRYWFKYFDITLYLNVLKIIRKIKKKKPHLIITQTNTAFPVIIAASIMKIPVINIIRETLLICPKSANITKYGIACSGLINRKTCYKCINYWRTLRVLIGNKEKGWQNSLKSTFSSLSYRIRYITCRFNIYLFNKATVNLIASDLMKSFLSSKIKPEKLLVSNITPIKKPDLNAAKKIKKNNLLFIIPKYDASHKGLDFIIRLSKFIPEGYYITIVGNILELNEVKENQKIINIGKVSKKVMNELYQTSKITLVPSFCIDAFGRVIIESILNNTPVISSPNCGAVYEIKESEYLKVIPTKIELWIKEIDRIIQNPIKIPENIKREIINKYSIAKSIDLLKTVINKLIKK